IRILSNLLAGYLLLVRPARPDAPQQGNVDRDLLRKRFELGLLSLQHDQFPNTVATALGLADVWASDPDRWWPDTVDLLVFGLEAMLRKGRREEPPRTDPVRQHLGCTSKPGITDRMSPDALPGHLSLVNIGWIMNQPINLHN